MVLRDETPSFALPVQFVLSQREDKEKNDRLFSPKYRTTTCQARFLQQIDRPPLFLSCRKKDRTRTICSSFLHVCLIRKRGLSEQSSSSKYLRRRHLESSYKEELKHVSRLQSLRRILLTSRSPLLCAPIRSAQNLLSVSLVIVRREREGVQRVQSPSGSVQQVKEKGEKANRKFLWCIIIRFPSRPLLLFLSFMHWMECE